MILQVVEISDNDDGTCTLKLDMDDDTLKSKYLEMCAKMEARGLMKKSEEVKKSEAPAADDKKGKKGKR